MIELPGLAFKFLHEQWCDKHHQKKKSKKRHTLFHKTVAGGDMNILSNDSV